MKYGGFAELLWVLIGTPAAAFILVFFRIMLKSFAISSEGKNTSER